MQSSVLHSTGNVVLVFFVCLFVFVCFANTNSPNSYSAPAKVAEMVIKHQTSNI